jgi:hypothetical protein
MCVAPPSLPIWPFHASTNVLIAGPATERNNVSARGDTLQPAGRYLLQLNPIHENLLLLVEEEADDDEPLLEPLREVASVDVTRNLLKLLLLRLREVVGREATKSSMLMIITQNRVNSSKNMVEAPCAVQNGLLLSAYLSGARQPKSSALGHAPPASYLTAIASNNEMHEPKQPNENIQI